MRREILPNGIEVVVQENKFSRLASLQCWVRVGSLNEKPHQRGMAHMIEHMLFKGTRSQKVGEISTSIEGVGGEINAFTSFDKTVYYLSTPGEHITSSIRVLGDAVADSIFDREEVEREKLVVLEEIRRSHDNPGFIVGRPIFERFFEGSEAARPIIGSEESVASFSRDDLFEFYRHWYQGSQMSVVCVGDFDEDTVLREIRREFGNIPGDLPLRPLPTVTSTPFNGPEIVIQKGDYQQPRIEMAFSGPGQDEVDALHIDLIAFILGCGESSRLVRWLRDQEQLVSSIGAHYFTLKGAGVFEISATTTEGKVVDSIAGILEVLAHLKSEMPINDEELARARSALTLDRIHQYETVSGVAQGLGNSLFSKFKLSFDEFYKFLVDTATSEKVMESLHQRIDLDQVVISCLLPKESSISEADIRKACNFGQINKSLGRSSVVKTRAGDPGSVEVRQILPGVKLVYQQNPRSELLNCCAVTEGGQRGESQENLGLFNAMSGMLSFGPSTMDYNDFLSQVEGQGAVFEGFSGKDSLGLKFQCLPGDLKSLSAIWRETLQQPAFRPEHWHIIKDEIEESIRATKDSPGSIAMRRLMELRYGLHPYGAPVYGESRTIKGLDEGSLLRSFQEWRSTGPWVVSAISPLPIEAIESEVEAAFASVVGPTPSRQFASIDVQFPQNKIVFEEMAREQVHTVLGYEGLSWEDPRRPALDVASTVLGGAGGRLFLKLRDHQSLAYSVSPILTYGCLPGIFGAYIACSPEKSDLALDMLRREVEGLGKESLTVDELDRAKNGIIGGQLMELQRAESLRLMVSELQVVFGVFRVRTNLTRLLF